MKRDVRRSLIVTLFVGAVLLVSWLARDDVLVLLLSRPGRIWAHETLVGRPPSRRVLSRTVKLLGREEGELTRLVAASVVLRYRSDLAPSGHKTIAFEGVHLRVPLDWQEFVRRCEIEFSLGLPSAADVPGILVTDSVAPVISES